MNRKKVCIQNPIQKKIGSYNGIFTSVIIKLPTNFHWFLKCIAIIKSYLEVYLGYLLRIAFKKANLKL